MAADLMYTRYDLFGSSFASSYSPRSWLPTATLSLQQDAEGNHCSSFPAALLPLIQAGSQLLRTDDGITSSDDFINSKQNNALNLLQAARSFSPTAWAIDLQSRSSAEDMFQRIEIASAHRAAVCIYLSRVVLALWPNAIFQDNLGTLAAEVMAHVLHIPPGDPLFTATAWPAFVTGLETFDYTKRAWVGRRFQDLWEAEPWGLTRDALKALEMIWDKRQSEGIRESRNWIEDLRKIGVHWLIVL